jgi:hypothetical protein
MNRFKKVEDLTKGKTTYSVGDTVHIKRWYHEEGSKNFHSMGNCLMVNVKHPITKITIDEETGRDTLWCGKFSTSTTDIANKGICV